MKVPNIQEAENRIQKAFETGSSHLDLGFLGLEELPVSLMNVAPQLTFLNLSHNNLHTLPPLEGFSKLEILHLSQNFLTKLPASIGSLATLEDLNLDFQQDLQVPFEFPSTIGNLKNLRQLNLSGLRLVVLPSSLFELTSLKILFLGFNPLGTLPVEIGNLSNLRVLYLPRTELSFLPKSVVKLKSLYSLNLFGNNFTEFPSHLKDLTSLTGLVIS